MMLWIDWMNKQYEEDDGQMKKETYRHCKSWYHQGQNNNNNDGDDGDCDDGDEKMMMKFQLKKSKNQTHIYSKERYYFIHD